MASRGLGLSEGLDHDINQDELDFSDLFLYNPPEDFSIGHDNDDPHGLLPNHSHTPQLVVDCSSAYHLSSSPQLEPNQNPTGEDQTQFSSPMGLSSRPSDIPAPSPRIEITPSGDSLNSQPHTQNLGSTALGAYRECASPASSNSSTGWPTENCSPLASPCPSPSNGAGYCVSALDLCPGLQSIRTSSTHSTPGGSPHNSIPDDAFLVPQQPNLPPQPSRPHHRSRSLSPQGKRSYHHLNSCPGPTPIKQRSRSPSPSPVPSPNEGSYYLHQYQTTTPLLKEMLSNPSNSIVMPSMVVHAPHRPIQRQDCVYGEGFEWSGVELDRGVKKEGKPETFYMVPTVWPAPHPTHHGAFSVSMAPLPSLEWQLPSELGQYKLEILQHPRAFHRAHYETEGSRGAVKTATGGHPEVQLFGYYGSSPLSLQVFIGTADEKLLKPHSFYQVHRVTGKTVTTHSLERAINGTKVLEIPLEPKNNMRVVIDCVGILKLRNADIELRNGETDIGRKNTRVRLVFRVHIPEPGGQLVSLQICSLPIECSQRAQEMPTVERQDLDRCSVLGGQQMVLTGLNFTSDSRVVFTEKTQDGEQIWEADATVDKDKTQFNMLFVEVPPYRDRRICRPVKVHFFVINGKKNMSQLQHFTYTPLIAIKAEPVDDYQVNYSYQENLAMSGLSMKSLYHHTEQDNTLQVLGVSPTLYSHLSTIDPRIHGLLPDQLDTSYHQYLSNPLLYHKQRYNNNSPTISCSTTHQKATFSNPCDTSQHGDAIGSSQEIRSSYQTLLGKSPPSRLTQVCRPKPSSESTNQGNSGRSDQEEPERTTVKQEHISYTYLEDVNDIIRRDLTDPSLK
ncbi:nuclear factor of activated T-cells, cytoplasmic 2-like [Periophthalmus magnuspinnatus]|uniref:nuclear factor of activated T-cells, cytoplasmic 2-like n=1 Tax=Periophthalmus magnuspinnatus TaxID=409849 RepID=UPI00145BFBD0|nr:nuclear factor of activated T-cells, cytoplasmic 2-like [Periophthalmus magnuspinnatus]